MEFEYMTEETAQRLNKALLSSIAAKEIIIKQLKTMNEKIDLTKILKDCPIGTKFYSPVWGKVSFERILDMEVYTIEIDTASGYQHLTKEGYYIKSDDAECILFPSKDQRDWSKFTAPWYKKERFDPKTLTAFDKVLVFDSDRPWTPLMFSYLEYTLNYPRMQCFDFVA